MMMTLSGSDGVGEIIPPMTYASFPLRTEPAVGLVKVTAQDSEFATIGDSTTMMTRGSARNPNFILAPELVKAGYFAHC